MSNGASRITDKCEVANKINLAVAAYNDCWEILTTIKTGNTTDGNLRIYDFQPRLAQAIYDLDRCYDSICQQQNDFISKKSNFRRDEFAKRMSTFADLRVAIDKAIHTGKLIGDSFAWFFYNKNQDTLTKQITKPRSMHTPPGVGGIGEITFVKAFPRFKHYFPIYHGITSLLRSGDFTLIDLRSFKVAALVELKTTKIDEHTLSLSLNTIGEQNIDDLAETFNLPTNPQRPPRQGTIQGFDQRLKRQLRTMASVIKRSVPDKHQQYHNAYHIQEIKDLSHELTIHQKAHKHVGESMLLVAANLPTASLAARLLDPKAHSFDIRALFPNLAKETHKIICKDSQHNRIILSEIDGDLPAGATPLFWWPLEISFLKKIFFREVWIASIYNPAHFAERLMQKGFVISGQGRPEQWNVHKPIGKSKATLQGLQYFLSAIQHHFMKETIVVDLIEKVTAEASTKGQDTKVNMIINHRMFQ